MRVIHSLCEMDNMDWKCHCQLFFNTKIAVLINESLFKVQSTVLLMSYFMKYLKYLITCTVYHFI